VKCAWWRYGVIFTVCHPCCREIAAINLVSQVNISMCNWAQLRGLRSLERWIVHHSSNRALIRFG
jgi:hypothetical protein